MRCAPRFHHCLSQARGFTLLELILVLVVIAALSGVAAASMFGQRDDSVVDQAAKHLVVLARHGQTTAVTSSHSVRLRVVSSAATAALVVIKDDGTLATPLGLSEEIALAPPSERLAITSVAADGTATALDEITDLLFQPDGRCDTPMTIRFSQGDQRATTRIYLGLRQAEQVEP